MTQLSLSPVTVAALSLIGLYGRYLSPHKGFRCAHAALHGGSGCSGAVAEILVRRGLRGGWREVTDRFAACRAAHDTLRGPAGLALRTQAGVRGVCCCGPIPIPFRCG